MFDAQFQENTKQLGGFGELEGYESGRKYEHNVFWDTFQENGTRTNYQYAFAGRGWGNDNLKPKYDIAPVEANSMFYCSLLPIDLVEHLNNLGIVLNTSNVINAISMFYGTQISHIGVLDFSKIAAESNAGNLFAWSNFLVTVDKIILPPNPLTFTSAFAGCSRLANITFEGTLFKSMSFQSCPLTLESAKSIILALKDYRDTANDGQFSCLFNAATWALLDADNTAPNGTWRDYFNSITWNY